MAGIDKIYGTDQQWQELHNFVAMSKRPQYCRYFYPTPNYNTEGAIMNNPVKVDKWLWDNCPFKWVKERLQFMYAGKKP